jgi:hypothetical protein
MTTTVRVHQSGAYWRRQFTSNAIDYTEAPDTIKWFTRGLRRRYRLLRRHGLNADAARTVLWDTLFDAQIYAGGHWVFVRNGLSMVAS